jgi:hypothetical protein
MCVIELGEQSRGQRKIFLLPVRNYSTKLHYTHLLDLKTEKYVKYYQLLFYMISKVLTVINVETMVFSDVTPYGLIDLPDYVSSHPRRP